MRQRALFLRIRKLFLALSGIVCLAACEVGSTTDRQVQSPPQPPHTYTTNFPLNEDPISENKVWINGGDTGLDWTNIQTRNGLAFGTQTGSWAYNDSIAVLDGSWGPNQSVTATVHTVNQQGENVIEEVEILLRFMISPHSARGYEINFRTVSSQASYSEVVRWNGPLGDFTYLSKNKGLEFGITNGTTVKASIIGNVIRVFINGVQRIQVTDNSVVDGNPGIGFFLANAHGVNGDFGFTSYAASDSQ